MRIVYECGYDGKECENYRVKLDKNGNVIEPKFKCYEEHKCSRCYFMGEPWARIVFKSDKN